MSKNEIFQKFVTKLELMLGPQNNILKQHEEIIRINIIQELKQKTYGTDLQAYNTAKGLINLTDPMYSRDSHLFLPDDTRAVIWITLLGCIGFTGSPICMLVSCFLLYVRCDPEHALCLEESHLEHNPVIATNKNIKDKKNLALTQLVTRVLGTHRAHEIILFLLTRDESQLPRRKFWNETALSFESGKFHRLVKSWSSHGTYKISDTNNMLYALGVDTAISTLHIPTQHCLFKDTESFAKGSEQKSALSVRNCAGCLWPECSYFFMHVAIRQKHKHAYFHALLLKVEKLEDESSLVMVFDHHACEGRQWMHGMQIGSFLDFHGKKIANIETCVYVHSFVQIPMRLHEIFDPTAMPDEKILKTLERNLDIKPSWCEYCSAFALREMSDALFDIEKGGHKQDKNWHKFMVQRSLKHYRAISNFDIESEKKYARLIEVCVRAREMGLNASFAKKTKACLTNNDTQNLLSQLKIDIEQKKEPQRQFHILFDKQDPNRVLGYCSVSVEHLEQLMTGLEKIFADPDDESQGSIPLVYKSVHMTAFKQEDEDCRENNYWNILFSEVYKKYIQNLPSMVFWVDFPVEMKSFRDNNIDILTEKNMLLISCDMWKCIEFVISGQEDWYEFVKDQFANKKSRLYKREFVVTELTEKNFKNISMFLNVIATIFARVVTYKYEEEEDAWTFPFWEEFDAIEDRVKNPLLPDVYEHLLADIENWKDQYNLEKYSLPQSNFDHKEYEQYTENKEPEKEKKETVHRDKQKFLTKKAKFGGMKDRLRFSQMTQDQLIRIIETEDNRKKQQFLGTRKLQDIDRQNLINYLLRDDPPPIALPNDLRLNLNIDLIMECLQRQEAQQERYGVWRMKNLRKVADEETTSQQPGTSAKAKDEKEEISTLA